MADEKRFDLLYKPQFGPDKNYRSEAEFGSVPLVAPPATNEPMEDIINGYDQILSFIDKLPEGLQAPIEDLLKKLKLRMQIIRYENPPPGVVVYPPPRPEKPPVGPPPTNPPTGPLPGPNEPKTYKPVPGGPNPPPGSTSEGTNPKPGKTHTTTYPPGHPKTIEPKPGLPPDPDSTNQPKVIYPIDGGPPLDYTVYPPVIGDDPDEPTTIDPSTDIDPAIKIGTDVTEEPPKIDGLPDMFSEPTNVAITVEVPKTLVEIAQDKYKKDQIDLQQYYLQQLQYALQEYFQAMMMVMLEVGIGDINMLQKDFDGDVVNIPDKNLQHLSDSIERSQVRKNQRARYFRKVCNTDQTLQHMRMWHAAEKERERYYGEAYGDSTNYLDSESNALLREARADYDAAYKSGLYNMYKYLDSSIEMTRDILTSNLKESQAKGKLLKEGVDVFKQKEVVTEMHNESESQAHDSSAQIQNNKGEGSGSGNVYDSGEDGTAASNASGSTSTSTASSSSSSGSSNNNLDFKTYGKAGSGTGGDDSYIKAPNGNDYSKNDIKYLTDKGYSQADAIAALAKDKKYAKATEFQKGVGADDSHIKAPNGQNYSNNDINYLTSKGYTKEQAIAELAKSETYVKKDTKYYSDIRKQVGAKMGFMTAQEYDRTDRKAPNGKWFEKNDVKYLTDQGYSEEDAYAALAQDAKYKKYTKTKVKAPNGTYYDENDVQYLISKGYSEEDAYATLAKDKKYKASKKQQISFVLDSASSKYEQQQKSEAAKKANDSSEWPGHTEKRYRQTAKKLTSIVMKYHPDANKAEQQKHCENLAGYWFWHGKSALLELVNGSWKPTTEKGKKQFQEMMDCLNSLPR